MALTKLGEWLRMRRNCEWQSSRPALNCVSDRPNGVGHQHEVPNASNHRNQCGDLLAIWLGKASAPEIAKLVAKEVGFNDSPFFGAEKKKIQFMGELVMANTALAIFAINQVVDAREAKSIIDPFLSVTNKSIFSVIEKKDSDFKRRYELRMSEYFRILSEDKPALGLSFSFMKNLGLDPWKNLQGQLLVAARFGDSLTKTLDVLRRMMLRSANPLQEFEREIESWLVGQAKIALLIIKAILSGNSEQIESCTLS